MALPVITNVFRCALDWAHSDGSHAVNVIHLKSAGATPTTVFTDLDASVSANMWKCMQAGASVISVAITPLDGTSATEDFATGAPAKWTGSASGSEYIPAVAGLVKLTTARRGRSYRGRVFLPYTGEDAQSAGRLVAGAYGPMQTAWNAFLAAITGAGTDFVVASYLHSTAEFVTNIFVEHECGTMRSRQERVRA